MLQQNLDRDELVSDVHYARPITSGAQEKFRRAPRVSDYYITVPRKGGSGPLRGKLSSDIFFFDFDEASRIDRA